MEAVRTRSIERRSRDIAVPNLDDPKLALKGAGQYAEMCMGCHLAPGMKESPTRQGLYPKPPKLAEREINPRRVFWVIKHGIKMTGMPAWGASHDDDTIWSLVAFLNQLPRLSPQQYKEMVDKAPRDKEMESMPAGIEHGSGGQSSSEPMITAPRK